MASQAAMLALVAQRGDVAVRTDLDPDGVFILSTDNPGTLADWIQITAPGAVISVNGESGAVVLTANEIGSTATGDVAATDVQGAIAELASEKVAKSLFDAQSVLAAVADDTPVAVTVAEQRLLGRITGGDIAALTPAQIRTLLDVPTNAEAVLDTLFDAHSIIKANADDTPIVQTVAEQRLIGRITGGNITDLTVAQIKTLLAYTAADIANTPAGEIAAATVQAALNELDTEKVPTGRPYRNFMRSGRYIVPHYGQTNTNALTLSRMVSVPIWIPDATTFDRIGISVTGAGGAGSTIRLGMHSDDGNGAPGALLLDAGTVDSSTTGVKEITISQAVPRGLLWLTYAAQGGTAPTVRTGIGSNAWISGPSATAIIDFALTGYRQDAVAGAFPAFSAITNADTATARIALRVA